MLSLISAPTGDVITLDEAKDQIRMDSSFKDDDALLQSHIYAAVDYVENQTCRRLLPHTYDLLLDQFEDEITIPVAPVSSITSITYIDTNGDSTVLDASKYTVDIKTEPARIIPAWGESWPVTRQTLNAVQVRFVVGYTDADAIPESIINAVKLYTQGLYDQDDDNRIKHAVFALLGRYSICGYAGQ